MAKVPDASKTIEIVIPTDDEPWPVLILKGPTDQAWDTLLRDVSKTVQKRHNKTEDVIDYDLMRGFIDDHLVGCDCIEVVVDSNYVKLDPVKHKNWKSRIPVAWKYTACGYFMSGGAGMRLREEEEKK